MDVLDCIQKQKLLLKNFENFYKKLPTTSLLVSCYLLQGRIEVQYRKDKDSFKLLEFQYCSNETHVLEDWHVTESELLEKVTEKLMLSDYSKVLIKIDGTYKVEGQYAKVTKHDDNSFTVQYFCPPEDPFSQPFTES